MRWAPNELGYEIEEVRGALGEHTAAPYFELKSYGQIPTAAQAARVLDGFGG